MLCSDVVYAIALVGLVGISWLVGLNTILLMFGVRKASFTN